MDGGHDDRRAEAEPTTPAPDGGTFEERLASKIGIPRSATTKDKAPLPFGTKETPAGVDGTGTTEDAPDSDDADWDAPDSDDAEWDADDSDDAEWDADEAAEEARQANREIAKRARRMTGILALVAALGVGFAGGVLYEKHGGHKGPAKLLAVAAASHGRANGRRHAIGPGGGTVVGTVASISGGTLYVSERSDSALVKVVTGPSSTVTVPSTASVSSIQPGDAVIVKGAKQANGSYMAGTITEKGSAGTGSAGTG
ncbi:MAG: hypothetical protein M0Z42_24785 [Actinomycetota bacterium]|nr:hypothetical protein [Actinomycetota bacterium]